MDVTYLEGPRSHYVLPRIITLNTTLLRRHTFLSHLSRNATICYVNVKFNVLKYDLLHSFAVMDSYALGFTAIFF